MNRELEISLSKEELREVFRIMEEQGWKPMLCDTPVPFYDNKVPCGIPKGMGDIVKETKMMPKEIFSKLSSFMVTATGDSMKDAGIVEGDIVGVETGVQISDGDIVVALIDGEFTLKSFYRDEEGSPWLVPQNDNYTPISLKDTHDVWIIGKVTALLKMSPRVSFRSCQKSVNRAKAQQAGTKEISQQQVSKTIREIAPTITVARQWYAVFRAMADAGVWGEEDFDSFCTKVQTEVPEHAHLPVRDEIQRMAILSFKKPVVLWDSDNAPVKGKRFNDYLYTARQTKKLLGGV